MGLDIDTPFPVEGTITPKPSGYRASLPCATEWLTETDNGDVLQQAVDRAARKHGEGVEVRVRFTSKGHGVAQDFEILGRESVLSLLDDLQGDPTMALRGPKDLGDKEHPDMEHADTEPRTAVRFVGRERGHPRFQIVTTRVQDFPIGNDMVDTHDSYSVQKWIESNDPETIDVDAEDGFEPTDFEMDPLAGVEA